MRITKFSIILFFVLSTSIYAGAQQEITYTIKNATGLSPVKNLRAQ
jgi:predicted branched-subunit amino acid permease